MTIYISVVSHRHADLIQELSCLSSLCQDFYVVVKSNVPNESFDELTSYDKFHWLNEQYGCGFGHNNNIVFDFCKTVLCMSESDYFVILNPDVVITTSQLYELIELMKQNKTPIAAINLFKDKDSQVYDNSVRNFPSLLQFTKSFLGYQNSSILDKSKITKPCNVDWAAGSFLAVKAGHYSELGGFDEKYFMYCEDIDICYRSAQMGHPVTFYPQIKALHLAKHANRKLFSKHFYWHVSSVIRFLLTKAGMTKTKSEISSITRKQ